MDPAPGQRPAGAAGGAPVLTRLLAVALLATAGLVQARGRLEATDLDAKREGTAVSGLPLVNYATDTGLGYGARIYLHANGRRDDPAFARTPWNAQIYAQFFRSTRGWEYHMINADLPEILGTENRVRLRAAFEGNTTRNWFGTGTLSLRPLPAADYAAYLAGLEADEPGGSGTTNGWFHKYELRRPFARAQVERWVTDNLLVMTGVELQRATVHRYDGRTVRVEAGDRVQGPTLAGTLRPTGIGGGNLHHVRAGIGWDTRDYEPAPKRGTTAEAVVEHAGPATGADWRYTRATVSARSFVGLPHDLIMATRGVWSVTDGTAPFFDAGTLSLIEGRTESLGGGWTMRGYRENRFAGKVVSLANLELRWNAGELLAGTQRFLFTPLLFADGGRIYDRPTHLMMTGWKAAAGGGIRIAWNRATILNATYGRSGEDSNVFVDFGHQF